MKTSTRISTAIVGLLLLAGTSPASAQYNTLEVRVPFEFMVGEADLPRDTYHVSRVDGHTDVLLVRGGRRAIFLLGRTVEPRPGVTMPHLVFHRYGDQYFLRQIRFLGTLGVSLPESRAERDAAERQAADFEVESVAIAARHQ
jgi:hypothetical protein